MAKMRVSEFAKELNIKSKDVLELLAGSAYEGKTASSNIDDDAQKLVRGKLGKSADATPAKEAPAKEKPQKVQPPKAVLEKDATAKAEPAGTRPAVHNTGGEAASEKKAKAADGNAVRKEAKPKASGENPGPAKEGARPKKKSSIAAVFNPQYSKTSRKPGSGNGRPGQGDPNRNRDRRGPGGKEERHSIIKPRPVGERTMRPISERTRDNRDDFSDIRARSNAGKERPAAAESNHTQRPASRPAADRRAERSARENRPRVERNIYRTPGAAPAPKSAGTKSRTDQRNDRFAGKDAAPSGSDVRGKESRERSTNRNNSRRKDYDKGSKHQENFVNLEKRSARKKPQPKPQVREDEDVIKTITLPEKLTIRDLADKMKQQPSAIVKKLFLKGQMVTVNQEVDFDTAEEIALEFNYICEPEEKIDVIAELLKEEEEKESDMTARPPVVCVMGHVDHGKTSLLDAIRSTRVTDREAGGITQHIGASVVSINDQTITFLDTPGHEAFTAMRMRGANSTDIAILVVAADDGVMPQTIEAINHAKAAGVEIIVAVNKIDKPSANIEKVKQELSEYELIPEDWGGSTIFCPVSAHTGEGIDNLLEMILLTADVLELKANPNRNARGLVIEAQLDKGRGAVATVLVQKGTLHVGDPIGCGSSYGKIRAMIDDKGRRVKEATPSTPVEVLGLNSVPDAGETFVCCDSEKEAKAFADTYISEEKNKLIEETKSKMSLDDLFSQIQSGNMKELDIIVKADVQGSVEAVKQSLVKLSNEEVIVKVIHGGVGAINESDVILASASNAIIIGFNVRLDPMAKITSDREGVDVRLYKVIYNAIEDVEAAMKGMLDPIYEEKVIGHAEIRQIFKASGVGNIAGSYVLDGVMERGCKVRISREGEQIFEGDLGSLKRFKDDVKEVKSGYECGLVFEGFNDIQELDVVEAYKMVEVPR